MINPRKNLIKQIKELASKIKANVKQLGNVDKTDFLAIEKDIPKFNKDKKKNRRGEIIYSFDEKHLDSIYEDLLDIYKGVEKKSYAKDEVFNNELQRVEKRGERAADFTEYSKDKIISSDKIFDASTMKDDLEEFAIDRKAEKEKLSKPYEYKLVSSTKPKKSAFIRQEYENRRNTSIFNYFAAMNYWLRNNEENYEILDGEIVYPIINMKYINIKGEVTGRSLGDNKTRMLYSVTKKSQLIKWINDNIKLTGFDTTIYGSDEEEIADNQLSLSGFRFFVLTKASITGGLDHYYEKSEKSKFEVKFFAEKLSVIDVRPSGKVENNNCLLDCIIFFLKLDLKPNKVREDLKLANNIKLGLPHIELIEEYFNIEIGIISHDVIPDTSLPGEKDRETNYIVKIVEIYKNGFTQKKENMITLHLHNEHFTIFHSLKEGNYQKEKKKGKKERKEKRYICFDYETNVSYSSFLKPFSVSCGVTNKKFELLEEIKFIPGFGCQAEFMKFLNKYNDPTYDNILMGFNNSKFDNFLLLELLAENDLLKRCSAFIVKGSLLGLRFLSFRTMDVSRFTPGSLKTNTINFGCANTKLEFSHKIPQEKYFSGKNDKEGEEKVEKWIEDNYDEIRDYNNTDVLCTIQLYQKIREQLVIFRDLVSKHLIGVYRKDVIILEQKIAYLSNSDKLSSAEKQIYECDFKHIKSDNDRKLELKKYCGFLEKKNNEINHMLTFEMEDTYTLSSYVNTLWSFTLGQKAVKSPKYYHIAATMKMAAYGGRSQINKPGYHKGVYQSYDCKSLYPGIMQAKRYPKGQEILTDKEIEGKDGIYYCNVIKQPPGLSNVIPLRKDGEPLNWSYRGQIKCFLTTTDMKVIRDFGGEIKVLPMMSSPEFYAELDSNPPIFPRKGKKESDVKFEKRVAEFEEDQEKLKTAVGYYWEESSYCFKSLIDILEKFKRDEDEKKAAGLPFNASLREMAKLCMNALSGKVGQSLFMNETKLCSNAQTQIEFIRNHKKIQAVPFTRAEAYFMKGEKTCMDFDINKKPWHISAFIYSFSREHMYRALISKLSGNVNKEHVWYATDTDSIHIKIADSYTMCEKTGKVTLKKFENGELVDCEKDMNGLIDEGPNKSAIFRFGKFHLGGEFLDFEGELDFYTDDAYHIMPKCYAYFGKMWDKDNQKIVNKEKKRFKGVCPNDKFLDMDVIKKHTAHMDEETKWALNYIPQAEEVTKTGELKRNKAFVRFNKAFSKLPEDIKFNIYNELPLAYTEKLFEDLSIMIEVEQEEQKKNMYKLIVLSSRLEKKLGMEKVAHMSQTYIMKCIAPSGIYF